MAGNPDILICGNCRELFNDIVDMLEHKKIYCKMRFTCKCDENLHSAADHGKCSTAGSGQIKSITYNESSSTNNKGNLTFNEMCPEHHSCRFTNTIFLNHFMPFVSDNKNITFVVKSIVLTVTGFIDSKAILSYLLETFECFFSFEHQFICNV